MKQWLQEGVFFSIIDPLDNSERRLHLKMVDGMVRMHLEDVDQVVVNDHGLYAANVLTAKPVYIGNQQLVELGVLLMAAGEVEDPESATELLVGYNVDKDELMSLEAQMQMIVCCLDEVIEEEDSDD